MSWFNEFSEMMKAAQQMEEDVAQKEKEIVDEKTKIKKHKARIAKGAAAFTDPTDQMLMEGYLEGEQLREQAKAASAQAPEAVARAGRAQQAAIDQAAARAQAAAAAQAGAGGMIGGGAAASARQGSLEAGAAKGQAAADTETAVVEARMADAMFQRQAGTPAEDFMEATREYGATIQSHQDDWATRKENTGLSDKQFKIEHRESWQDMIDGLIATEANPYVRAWLLTMRESFGKSYAEAAAAAYRDSGFMQTPSGKALFGSEPKA